MNEKYQEFLSSFCALLLNGLLIHYFFLRSNIYNDEPIYYMEHINLLAGCLLITFILIPIFKEYYGYSLYNWSGIVIGPLAPLGFLFFISLLVYLGFNIVVAYKITLFLGILIQTYIPYIIVKHLSKSYFSGIIATIWLWFGDDSKFWLRRFSYGGYQFQVTFALTLLFLFLISNIDFNQESTRKFNKTHVKYIIFLSIIANLHYFTALVLGIVVIQDLLFEFIKERKLTNLLKNKFIFYTYVAFFSILINATWIIPTIFIHLPNMMNTRDNPSELLSFEKSMSFIMEYMTDNWIWFIVINIMILYLYRYYKSNPIFKILLYFFYDSLFLIFIMPFSGLIFFLGVNSYRYVLIIEIEGAIIFGLFFKKILENLISLFKRIRTKSIKLHWSQLIIKPMVLTIVLIAALFPFKVANYYITENSLDPNDEYVINWVSANTTKESRILYQNSRDYYGTGRTPAYFTLYISYITDRYFASGIPIEQPMTNGVDSNYIDDIIFSKVITDLNQTEIEFYLDLFNIEYIIISHGISIDYFNNLTTNSSDFIKLEQSHEHYFFRYVNCSKSYIVSDQVIKEFSMEHNKIDFKISNYSTDKTVIVSAHDYNNWIVYINGNRVEKEQNPYGLIQFSIPDQFDGELSIEIIWERLPIQVISNILSIIGIGIMTFFSIKTRKIKTLSTQNEAKKEILN